MWRCGGGGANPKLVLHSSRNIRDYPRVSKSDRSASRVLPSSTTPPACLRGFAASNLPAAWRGSDRMSETTQRDMIYSSYFDPNLGLRIYPLPSSHHCLPFVPLYLRSDDPYLRFWSRSKLTFSTFDSRSPLSPLPTSSRLPHSSVSPWKLYAFLSFLVYTARKV